MRFEQAHIEMNAETTFELRASPATERRKRDTNGRVAIDWGAYGLPETFVITKDGRIAHKHIGPLLPYHLESTVFPLIRELHQR
jgi:hypothetical protein